MDLGLVFIRPENAESEKLAMRIMFNIANACHGELAKVFPDEKEVDGKIIERVFLTGDGENFQNIVQAIAKDHGIFVRPGRGAEPKAELIMHFN